MTTTSRGTAATTGWPIALSCAPLQHICGGGESVNEPHVGCIQCILEHMGTQLACYLIPLLLILLHNLAIFRWEVKNAKYTANSPLKGK